MACRTWASAAWAASRCLAPVLERFEQCNYRFRVGCYEYFFPTCQARVVRFFVSLPASSFLPPSSAPRRGPNSNLRISVPPPLQAPGQSVPCRTSTASSGSECSPPDLNHKESPKIYQIECQKECQKISQIDMPQKSVRENAR